MHVGTHDDACMMCIGYVVCVHDRWGTRYVLIVGTSTCMGGEYIVYMCDGREYVCYVCYTTICMLNLMLPTCSWVY